MRIGVISDTHIPDMADGLPSSVMKAFSRVDLILHAGDITEAYVLDELERIAPVLAVRGDDDGSLLDGRVEDIQELNLKGLRLCMIHDIQSSARDFVLHPEDKEPTENHDLVIYGHIHYPMVESYRTRLLISPGSATFPYYRLRPGTVALLEVSRTGAEATIVQLSEQLNAHPLSHYHGAIKLR